MNTYFYSAANSSCDTECDFLTCSKRCVSLLSSLPAITDIKVLPSGSMFKTPSSMDLRSGDIIILYAKDKADMDTLFSFSDFFEPYRIILIVGQNQLVKYGSHYTLTPRYTMTISAGMKQLSQVLNRMTTGDKYNSGETFPTTQERSHA